MSAFFNLAPISNLKSALLVCPFNFAALQSLCAYFNFPLLMPQVSLEPFLFSAQVNTRIPLRFVQSAFHFCILNVTLVWQIDSNQVRGCLWSFKFAKQGLPYKRHHCFTINPSRTIEKLSLRLLIFVMLHFDNSHCCPTGRAPKWELAMLCSAESALTRHQSIWCKL